MPCNHMLWNMIEKNVRKKSVWLLWEWIIFCNFVQTLGNRVYQSIWRQHFIYMTYRQVSRAYMTIWKVMRVSTPP